MKKIALVIVLILFLSGLVYSQEAPEGVIRKTNYDGGAMKVNAGNYMGGDFDGPHIARTQEFYENGLLKREVIPDGKVGGSVVKGYYESGQLKYKILFWDYVNGDYKEYYKNGQLKMDRHFTAEGHIGIGKDYCENGQLKREWDFKDEKSIFYKECDEEGNLVSDEG